MKEVAISSLFAVADHTKGTGTKVRALIYTERKR